MASPFDLLVPDLSNCCCNILCDCYLIQGQYRRPKKLRMKWPGCLSLCCQGFGPNYPGGTVTVTYDNSSFTRWIEFDWPETNITPAGNGPDSNSEVNPDDLCVRFIPITLDPPTEFRAGFGEVTAFDYSCRYVYGDGTSEVVPGNQKFFQAFLVCGNYFDGHINTGPYLHLLIRDPNYFNSLAGSGHETEVLRGSVLIDSSTSFVVDFSSTVVAPPSSGGTQCPGTTFLAQVTF